MINQNLIVILFFSLLCSSCSNTSITPEISTFKITPEQILLDDKFPLYKQYKIVDAEDIYVLDQQMLDFVHYNLLHIEDPYKRSEALLTKLFNQSNGSLRYNNGANLTARETFYQNTANCLSLTILAFALADEARLNVKFQQIDIPEYWIREGDFSMLTGHVNLRVTSEQNPLKIIFGSNDLVIDFDPQSSRNFFNTTIITKNTVTAMFYNNKGAQALVTQQYDLAYAYFKKAVNIAPQYSTAWANLGLAYKFIGDKDTAELSYKYALTLDNDNYNAWNNLAILYTSTDQVEQAEPINQYLAKIRLSNPYYHALLGDEAYYRGDYHQSIKHYKKAKSMSSKEHEFYFGLAKAFYQLGDHETSELYLIKAKKFANFKDVEDKYQRKLNLFTGL